MSKQLPNVRQYELVLIVDPDIANPVEVLERAKGFISEAEGEIVRVDDWGKRELAYPIQKKTHGTYYCVVFEGSGNCVSQLERNLKITDTIFRFMVVHKDDFAPDSIPSLGEDAAGAEEVKEG